jgi:nucleotide-binding universal stress UspA family protein
MNQILVAYDCSPEADKALAHSISIADPEDEILILMVIPEPENVFYVDDYDENSIEKVKGKLELVKNKYNNTGLKISTQVIKGQIVTEILKASENPNCKLIVLGYEGVSKIGRFKLGSVSGKVAKLANKPVLVVK